MSRCTATVHAHSLEIRSRYASTEPRCQRQATVGDLCSQHANMRWCQTRFCDKRAAAQVGDWWFCRHHARLWFEHDLIVNRIRSIPPRP